MAERPVFIAKKNIVGVTIKTIQFEYYSGFSIQQKQRSILSLHENARLKGINKILEVSTKSEANLGNELSAFNLKSKTLKNNLEFTVEKAFQGSKVFENGGPYIDLFYKDSKSAKTDDRIRNSGNLINFKFFNYIFNLDPPTFFYDWLYINTLLKNSNLINEIKTYNAFTDIEFNPKRSINCQAYSVALFVSFISNNISLDDMKNPKIMCKHAKNEYEHRWKKEYHDQAFELIK